MKTIEIIRQNGLLIFGLGALALIRPVLKITGIMDMIGQPFGTMLVTVCISIIWLAAVVIKKSRHPVRILVLAGVWYGVSAILLSGILSPILDHQLQGPLTNPFAMVSVIATNALWGLIVGVCSLAFIRKRT